jgi:hypothetical protein
VVPIGESAKALAGLALLYGGALFAPELALAVLANPVVVNQAGIIAAEVAGVGAGASFLRNGGRGADIVYRVIRADENPLVGLVAKNPAATYTLEGFITNGSRPGFASQFIATTRSIEVATENAIRSGNRIVAIDLSKVAGKVFDLSTSAGRDRFLRGILAKRFSEKSAEVVIEGSVPVDAITIVR